MTISFSASTSPYNPSLSLSLSPFLGVFSCRRVILCWGILHFLFFFYFIVYFFLGFFDPSHPFSLFNLLTVIYFFIGLFSFGRFFPVCSFPLWVLVSSVIPCAFEFLCSVLYVPFVSVLPLLNGLLMSLTVGVVSSCSRSMGFDENKGDDGSKEDKSNNNNKAAGTKQPEADDANIERQMSERSLYATEDEDDESDVEGRKIDLGPQFTIKQQLEKDKDDESLRKWKEQLLGSVDINSIGETLEPDVKILSLAIKSPGRPDIFLPVPESGNPKGLWFSLKEGSRYSLKFTFQVNNNIVLGLKYKNAVWKTGVKVDSTKEMLGTFSPQLEPYMHEMPEETTPSGFFARGTYSARTKFVDDDNKCYLKINYTFDIRKDWQ